MDENTEAAIDAPSKTKLPGVIKLIETGFSIYIKRFWVLTSISALQLVSMIIFVVPAILFVLFGMGIITVSALVVAIVVYVWLYLWFTLAILEVIRGHMEDVGFKKAFQLANPNIAQFLWLFLLTFSVYIGSVAVGALIPGMAIAGIGIASGVAELAIIGMMLTFILWVSIAVLLSVCLAFVYWVFVDRNIRGVNVLVDSVATVRGRFWAVLWRIVATGFLLSVAYSILSFFIGPIVSLFVPFSLIVVYMIYESVKVGYVVQPEKDNTTRKIITVLAWAGLVIVLLVPTMMMSMMWSVPMA